MFCDFIFIQKINKQVVAIMLQSVEILVGGIYEYSG